MTLILELTGSSVRPIQDLAPWVAPALAQVLHGALVRDPDLRCPSICDLVVALQSAVGLDVASKPVHPSSLVSAPLGLRSSVASRAVPVTSWDEVLSA